MNTQSPNHKRAQFLMHRDDLRSALSHSKTVIAGVSLLFLGLLASAQAQLILKEVVRSDSRFDAPEGTLTALEYNIFGPDAAAPGVPVYLGDVKFEGYTRRAIWRGKTLIARNDNGSEEATGSNGVFQGLLSPIGNAQGALAWYGQTSQGQGYWTRGAGTGNPQVIAQEGTAAPGTNTTFHFPDQFTPFLAFNNSGLAAFQSFLNGGTTSNDYGIWTGAPGALKLVARDGDQAAGLPAGVKYDGLEGAGIKLNNAGKVAFSGYGGVGFYGNSARCIWAGLPGALQLVARDGDPSPDVNDGSVLRLSGGFSFNDAGEVTFVADLQAPQGASAGQVLYAGKAGALRVVAAKGMQPPGVEAGAQFTGFQSQPTINASGEVLFWADYNSATTPAGQGLWVGRRGELRLVAKADAVAPGTGGAKFTRFPEQHPLMLSDSGRVVFAAYLDSASGTNQALFVTDKTGALRMIARTGQSINGSPPVNQLIVVPENPPPVGNGEGHRVGIDANGEVVFTAAWQNPGGSYLGREAMFLASFKEDKPPQILWAAGRDLQENEKSGNADEAKATNTVLPEWSYGSRTTATGTALTLFPESAHKNDSSGIEGWVGPGARTFAVNTKSENIVFNTGSGNYFPLLPAQIYMNPGSVNEFLVARWKAPSDGDYRLVAKWLDLDNHGGNGATAHLVINGKEEFVQSFESTPTKRNRARLRSKNVSLKTGDLVDFVLGSKGDITFDATAFNAAIYRIPKVTITSPAPTTPGNELSAAQDVVVNVNVQTPEPVAKVNLQVDDDTVQTDTTPPYTFTTRLEPGPHRLTAVAIDKRRAPVESPEVAVAVVAAPAASMRAGDGGKRESVKAAAATGGRVIYTKQSGLWENPNTWDAQGVPGPEDTAVIQPGHLVSFESDLTVAGLDVTPSGLLSREGNTFVPSLTVNGAAHVSGRLFGPLNLEIGPPGKLLLKGKAELGSIHIVNYGKTRITGEQLRGQGNTIVNQGDLAIHSPIGSQAPMTPPLVVTQLGGTAGLGTNVAVPVDKVAGGTVALSKDHSPLVPAGLVSENGLGLIGNDGSTLIGNDGSTLIGNDGSTLIGNDGSTLRGPDGALLIGNDGSTLIGNDGSTLQINGGSLTGTGEIRGNVVNQAGFVVPGHSPGGIVITGNYTQQTGGTLVLELGGKTISPFTYDILQVAGKATLGGNLVVKTINGYVQASGDKVSPLLYGSYTGNFASVSSNAQLTFGTTGAEVKVSGPNPQGPRALNISTRLQIQSGDNVLFAGFIVTGPAGSTKKVLIRGIGPSLAKFGVAGTIPDPFLELHTSSATITNDDWAQSPNANQIPNGFAPSNPKESAIVATLGPGSYSAVLKGAHGETGVGLAEVYDLEPNSGAQLANIATRGFVQTGDSVLIGGFIISGNQPAKVLVRAIGPSLSAFLPGALQDTVLEVHDANGGVLSNDNWRETDEAGITSTTIPPSHDKESAVLAVLAPGNYTAVVRGKDGATGIAVVEAYNLQ